MTKKGRGGGGMATGPSSGSIVEQGRVGVSAAIRQTKRAIEGRGWRRETMRAQGGGKALCVGGSPPPPAAAMHSVSRASDWQILSLKAPLVYV